MAFQGKHQQPEPVDSLPAGKVGAGNALYEPDPQQHGHPKVVQGVG